MFDFTAVLRSKAPAIALSAPTSGPPGPVAGNSSDFLVEDGVLPRASFFKRKTIS